MGDCIPTVSDDMLDIVNEEAKLLTAVSEDVSLSNSPVIECDEPIDMSKDSINLNKLNHDNISLISQLDGITDDIDDTEATLEVSLPHTNITPTSQHPTENLHSTVSIHLRNVPVFVTKAELEGIFTKYDGYIRLALSDPNPERKWSRKGWATFIGGTNIKDICCKLGDRKIGGVDIGPVVNKELSKRVRLVSGLSNYKKVMRADLRMASKLISIFDEKWGLEESMSGLKLLDNIADYLVEEVNAEEEELLGISREDGEDVSGTVTVVKDKDLAKVLDKMLIYLRVVHSFDFYNHAVYPHEDQMPNRLGLIHARGHAPNEKVSLEDVDEYIEKFEKRMCRFLLVKKDLSDKEVKSLGGKSEEEEVEKFISLNSQELAKDKWLCPLSGKKFKGPEFIRKHILSKFSLSVEQVRIEAQYFNNYLRDPSRPELLEILKGRHNNVGRRKHDEDRRNYNPGLREATSYPVYERGRGGWGRHPFHHRGGGGYRGGWGGHNPRDRYQGRSYDDRIDPRAVIDYSDVDITDWK